MKKLGLIENKVQSRLGGTDMEKKKLKIVRHLKVSEQNFCQLFFILKMLVCGI